MINVVINGYKGKMGSEAVKAVSAAEDMQVSGQCDVGDNVASIIKAVHADVVVDLTNPSSVRSNAESILRAGAHAVVGTTGLSDQDLEALNQIALTENRAIIVCPNFAIGAVLMMKLAAEAAKYLHQVEIIEFHHDKKADAPSGTALKTADMIAAANPEINATERDEKELIPGSRGARRRRIPIHAIRLPGIVANQEVIFGGLGQTLSIRHDTHSRECFMPGILLCIRKIRDHKGLIYGLEHLL